jgi:hypothetical protein
VFRLIQRNGAGRAVAGDVHAKELGEVTHVLDRLNLNRASS